MRQLHARIQCTVAWWFVACSGDAQQKVELGECWHLTLEEHAELVANTLVPLARLHASRQFSSQGGLA
jgi:hypothetical protein